jgi:hypothetical protein
MIFLPGEAKRVKAFFRKVSPTGLLIAIIFFLGYNLGAHMSSVEISLNCKYANAFRVGTDSFNCNKKI